MLTLRDIVFCTRCFNIILETFPIKVIHSFKFHKQTVKSWQHLLSNYNAFPPLSHKQLFNTTNKQRECFKKHVYCKKNGRQSVDLRCFTFPFPFKHTQNNKALECTLGLKKPKPKHFPLNPNRCCCLLGKTGTRVLRNPHK